jgi:hypothetical protein
MRFTRKTICSAFCIWRTIRYDKEREAKLVYPPPTPVIRCRDLYKATVASGKVSRQSAAPSGSEYRRDPVETRASSTNAPARVARLAIDS